MATKDQAPVQTVSATRDVDYVSAGQIYSVQREGRFHYFQNVRTGGRTSVAAWQFDQAVRSGAFVVTAA